LFELIQEEAGKSLRQKIINVYNAWENFTLMLSIEEM